MSRLIGSKQSASLTDKVTSITSSTNFTADATAGVTPDCKLLVVAGGGGSCHGGGGAGGYREIDPHPLPASSVPVTIGAGGAGGPENTIGAKGSDSVFGSATPISSTGGGGGGGLAVGGSSEGQPGGSSGGSGGNTPTGTTVNPGNEGDYDPPEGNNGGQGRYNGSSYYAGGGGGGAGGNGGNETPGPADSQAVAGQGGLGAESNVSGSPVYYAGGGGGGYRFSWKLWPEAAQYRYGAPGGHTMGGGKRLINEKGGAGDASNSGGDAGIANTGGGGGGATLAQSPPAMPSVPGAGSAAGSGIVIVSEPNATWSAGGVWDTQQAFKQKVEGNWR